jgi:hypothetical protein
VGILEPISSALLSTLNPRVFGPLFASYFGYRGRTQNVPDTKVRDNQEQLYVAKFGSSGCRFPLHKFLLPFEYELETFQKKLWESVLKKLLVLLEIILELPDGHLVSMHDYSRASDDFLSYVSEKFLSAPFSPCRPATF